MLKIFAIAALIVAASALPSAVEEPVSAIHQQAAEEAQSTVTELLQAGKDEGACADLADATIKEVEDSVANQQKILNSLDTGADCPKKGQDAVDNAKGQLQAAIKNKKDADDAWAAAKTAMVKISPKSLSSLNPNDCGFVFNDPAYESAKTAAENAEAAAVAAAGVVTSAEKAVDDAEAAQVKLVNECRCNVKKAYAAAWEAANKNNDADAKAYTKGKHMKCVLAGTSPATCSVGDIPTVTAVTLAAGVDEAQCDDHEDSPSPPAHESKKVTCDLTIDNVVTDIQYNGVPVHLVSGNMGAWNSNKVITFDSAPNGVLMVGGYDSEGGNTGHCGTAGFAIQCQSEDSFWGSFSSASPAIQAAGGQQTHGGINGPFNAWGTPCTSTSGFYLPANSNAKKLWAPNGERWAKFQMGPSFQ